MGKGTLIGRLKKGEFRDLIGNFIWVLKGARKYWKEMILLTVFGMSGVLVSIIQSFVSRDMVDIITGQSAGKMIFTFALLISVALFSSVITQLSTYLNVKIVLKVEMNIKADVYAKIMNSEWEELSQFHTGDLAVRWSGDCSTLASAMLTFIPNCITLVFRFFSALIIMLQNDWTFAVISFVSMPISMLISRNMMVKMRKNNMSGAEINAKMSGFNQESFSNIQLLKSFNLVPGYIKKLHTLQGEYIRFRLKTQKSSIIMSLIMVLTSLVVSYVSYGWGIYRIWSGAITYGTMTLFVGMSSSLSSSLNSIVSLIPQVVSISTAAARVIEISELPKEDYSNQAEVEAFAARYEKEGFAINIDGIDYTYRNGTEVFENATIYAKPHEIVALVGPSGEGKTTMMRVVLSLVRPQGGEKYVEAKNEKIVLNAAARQLFSYVPQGNTMFSGTIAENMRDVCPGATDEDIKKALEMACAWEFVGRLPDGINSMVQERGGGFSEGQAQRLSIARALLCKKPILLLDEATSALDVRTEKRLLRNIVGDNYPRTCLVTTHRMSVLNICSRVYEIREKGCHEMTEEEIEELKNV